MTSNKKSHQRSKTFLTIFLTFHLISLALGDTPNECGIKYCLSCDQKTQLCLKCKGDLAFSREEVQCLPVTDCPIGQYKLTKTSQCITCHQSCKSCYGQKFSECYECVDGYTFFRDNYQNNICIPCAAQNCFSCDHLGICAICQDGYTLNNTTGLCEQCLVSQCQDCSGSKDTCNLCFSSFTLSSDKTTCVLKGNCIIRYFEDSQEQCTNSCDPSCTHCYGLGNNFCYDCADGYYLSGDLCLKCSDSCFTCQYRSDYCTSCLKGSSFVLDGSTCKQSCPTGQYAESSICLPCSYNCTNCLDKNTCKSCADQQQQKESSGVCINVCTDGQYNRGSKFYTNCFLCDPNCKTCFNQFECSSCQNGQILSKGRCVNKCNTNQYVENNTFYNHTLCVDCPYPCLSCNNSRECTSCADGFTNGNDGSCYYSGIEYNNCSEGQTKINNLCLDECPDGSIQKGNICTCDYSCAYCTFQMDIQTIDCNICYDSRQISYQGVCYSNCPNDLYLYSQNIGFKQCVKNCPQNTMIQISDQQKSCVRYCSNGYILQQNICIQPVCLSKQFFDLKTFFSDLAANKQNSLSTYCISCNISCKTCDGPAAEDCLICTSGLVSQQLVDLSGAAYISCQQNCNSGYNQITTYNRDGSTFQSCQICYFNCQSCSSGYYSIMVGLLTNQIISVYNCYSDCPSGTVSNPQSMTCIISIDSSIEIQKDNSTGFFCAQANIPIIFTITTIIKLSASLSPICIIKELNTQLAMLDSQTGVYSKYKGIISSNTLQEGQTYTVSCSSTLNGQKFSSQSTLSTFQLNFGNFKVSPTTGIANVDVFQFNISQFALSNSIDQSSYLLQYALLAELPNSLNTMSNITIFKTSSTFYTQYPNLKINFNYVFPFIFPQISKQQDINMFLVVAGVSYLSQTYKITLHLSPQTLPSSTSVTSVSPIISNIIASMQDKASPSGAYKSEQFSQFLLQLQTSGLLPVLDTGKNDNLIKEKSALQQSIPCDSASNCSSNGKCKKIINSYFDRCDCNNGFAGEKCSWKLQDLNTVSKIFQSSLSSLLTEINTISSLPLNQFIDKLEKIALLLNSVGKIRDVFNQQAANDYLSMLQNNQFYASSSTQDQALFILSANDLGIDIQRKFNSTSFISHTKDNIQKSLFYYFQKMSLGSQYQFSLNNIDGIISDLSFANYASDSVSYSSAQSTWSVSIPTNIFGNVGSKLFAQVINWPTDFDQFDNKTQNSAIFNIKASSMTEITIRKKDSSSDIFAVENIKSPININLNQTVQDSDIIGQTNQTLNLSCMYQLNNGSWVSDGLKIIKNQQSSSYTCQTFHLTQFSLGYTQQNIPSSENQQQDEWAINFKAYATSNFCLMLILSHLLSLILFLKKNKKVQTIKLRQDFQSPRKLLSIFDREPKLQLQGVTVGVGEECTPIEGIPLEIKDQQNQKLPHSQNKRSNQIQIESVDIGTENCMRNKLFQSNYAMNVARRAKEGEIDQYTQEDKDGILTDKQKFRNKDREINFIPISTFYQSDQKMTINQNQSVKNFVKQEEEYKINFEIPQGIPERKIKQVQDVLNQQPQSLDVVICYPQQSQIMNYHPIYTFTRDLERVGLLFRVFVFFEVLCLIEALTLKYSTENSEIKIQKVSDYILVFFLTTIARRLINFLVSFGLSFLAIIQKICFKEATIANSIIIKYLCLQVITVLCLISFYQGASVFKQMVDIGKLYLSFAINIFFDYFILEYILLKVNSFCCENFFFRLAQRSNFDQNF